MRSARRFRKRIQLWQITEVGDGYGGYTLEDLHITDTWADIRALSNRPYNDISNDFGVNQADLAVQITVRKRKDLTYNSINQYIIYNGDKYNILTYPEDKNFDGRFVTFIAYKDALKSVSVIEPLNMTNSIYSAYETRVEFAGATITGEGCQKYFINELLNG